MLDYLIIGQGIAGSLLSYELLKKTDNILVIDKENPNASSLVACGICNPIVGKYIKKTWLVNQFFRQLLDTYKDIEDILSIKFMKEISIYRQYHTIEEQNKIIALSAEQEWKTYINTEVDNEHYRFFMDNELGGWETKNSFQINGSELLTNWRKYLTQKQKYENIDFDENKIIFHENYFEYEHIKTKKIIFCRGFEDSKSIFFESLPFALVKGEWLKIKIDTKQELKGIIIENCFLLPLENQEYIVGSTYHWDNLTEEISTEAKEELIEKLNHFIKLKYEIIEQRVGIRPATHTRRPFLGRTLEHQNMFIFNGLGTKGFSIAPYFAKQMAQYLDTNDENILDSEVKIKYKPK